VTKDSQPNAAPTAAALVAALGGEVPSPPEADGVPTMFWMGSRTPVERDAERDAYWDRVQREGGEVVDTEGNIIAHLLPAPKRNEDGSVTFKVSPPDAEAIIATS